MTKKILTISLTISLFIVFSTIFSHAATRGKIKDDPKPARYTDINKKVLNIGKANYHLIRKGDTIWGTLIKENDVDPNHYNYYLKELLRLNPKIKDPNLIYAGDTMIVPHIPKEHQKKWVPRKPAAAQKRPKTVKAEKKSGKPALPSAPVKKSAEKPKPKKERPKVARVSKNGGAPSKKPLSPKTILIQPPPQASKQRPKKVTPKKPKTARKPKPKTAKKPPPPKKKKKKDQPPKVSDKLQFSILSEFPERDPTKRPKPPPKKVTPPPKKARKPKPKKVAKVAPPAAKKTGKPKKTEPKKPKVVEKPRVIKKPKEPAKKAGPSGKRAQIKIVKTPAKPAAGAAKAPSKSGAAGITGISTIPSKTGSVIIGNVLKEAIESISDKVVTKGVLYFPVKGKKAIRINKALAPVVHSGNKKIVLDYGNKIKKRDEDYIKNKYDFYDFLNVRRSDPDKVVIGKVLKASGYHSVRENREIKVGKNIKLVIRYDWLIEKKSSSFLDGDVKLLKTKVSDGDQAPAYIKKYLSKLGFFISELKVSKQNKAPKLKKRAGNIISLSKHKEISGMIKSLLDTLGIKAKESAALKFHVEDKPSMYADFYFEIGSNAYIISLKQSSKKKLEMAKKHEIAILDIDPKQNRNDITKKVLNLLHKEYSYATYRLLGDKTLKPFLDVEVKGFLIGKHKAGSTSTGIGYELLVSDANTVFVTNYKFPLTIKRFVTDSGYKVLEK